VFRKAVEQNASECRADILYREKKEKRKSIPEIKKMIAWASLLQSEGAPTSRLLEEEKKKKNKKEKENPVPTSSAPFARPSERK